MMNSGGIPAELSHSGLIPVDSGNSGLIPVDSGLIPADSGAILPESAGITGFRTESVGHQKVQEILVVQGKELELKESSSL